MAYRIIATGTLRSGKTTLLNTLKNDSRVVIVPEVAQDLIDLHGYSVTQRPEFQDMVFAEQLHREKVASQSGKEIIICDRGTVDIVAFSQIIGHEIKAAWEENLHNRYDAAALFNPDDIHFQPSEYSVSFDMAEYRARIHNKILEVVQQVGLPILEIAGPHEER